MDIFLIYTVLNLTISTFLTLFCWYTDTSFIPAIPNGILAVLIYLLFVAK